MQIFIFSVLLTTFILLNFLDADSTIKVINLGSYKNEKNPFARFFIKKFGAIKGVILVKSLLLFIIPLIIYYYLHEPLTIIVFMLVACVAYILVVLNNYRLARRLQRKNEFSKILNNKIEGTKKT